MVTEHAVLTMDGMHSLCLPGKTYKLCSVPIQNESYVTYSGGSDDSLPLSYACKMRGGKNKQAKENRKTKWSIRSSNNEWIRYFVFDGIA